jgi:hypothetical protein
LHQVLRVSISKAELTCCQSHHRILHGARLSMN